MYPNWEQVEYAITFLISFCTRPTVAAKNAVIAPRTVIATNVVGLYSINGENLIIKKIPAVTIVAAWIRAETGVGASIASGNQVCKPNWALLPAAPNSSKIPTAVIVLTSKVPKTNVSLSK